VVALDAMSEATGFLFLDDGSSFEYQKGAYIYREFLYKTGTLTSKTLNKSKHYYQCSNHIERIIILGLKRPKNLILKVDYPF